MNYIISLNNKTMPNKEILQHVGGKGESLIKMCQAGFPVPEGYVIREDAWDNQGLKKEAGKENTSGSNPQKNTNRIKRRKTSGRQIHIHL